MSFFRLQFELVPSGDRGQLLQPPNIVKYVSINATGKIKNNAETPPLCGYNTRRYPTGLKFISWLQPVNSLLITDILILFMILSKRTKTEMAELTNTRLNLT